MDEAQAVPRGFAARLGATALNLLLPGLGLLRLNRVHIGFGLIIVTLGLSAGLALAFANFPPLSRTAYLSLIAGFACWALIAYLWSLIATWRYSKMVEPRSGQMWHWYTLVAVLALAIGTNELTLNSIRGSYRSFFMPSVSMAPTLNPGDRFVGHMRSIEQLRRGDLVIVKRGHTEYVKRVAGLPGDRLALAEGIVIINGARIVQRPVGTYRQPDQFQQEVSRVLAERFPGEATEHRIVDLRPTPQDDFAAVTLPAQTYFLLGDNRDNSEDSRFPETGYGGLGLVSRERIIGKVLFKLW